MHSTFLLFKFKTMKTILAIAILIILTGCEKKPYVNGDVVLEMRTCLPPGQTGTSPKGLYIKYLDTKIIYDTCKYVGKIYKVKGLSGTRMYAKATAFNDDWVSIAYIYEGDTLIHRTAFKEVEIDDIY